MMNKYQKTEYLFSAIGEVDDRLLEEALRYRPARKRRYWIPVLAACLSVFLLLSATVALSVVVVPIGVILFGNAGNQAEEPEFSPEEEHYASLDDLMTAQREEDGYLVYASAEELTYYGSASIIWQYVDSDEYYVAPIGKGELSLIQSRMGYGSEVGDELVSLNCRVWICDGKGNVRTPYLKNTVGNQDVEVFDYDPELIPQEYFIDCISDVLNDTN